MLIQNKAFATCLRHELKCFSGYVSAEQMSHWRPTSGFEVDSIVGDHTGIQAKAKEKISPNDIKPLQVLME